MLGLKMPIDILIPKLKSYLHK